VPYTILKDELYMSLIRKVCTVRNNRSCGHRFYYSTCKIKFQTKKQILHPYYKCRHDYHWLMVMDTHRPILLDSKFGSLRVKADDRRDVCCATFVAQLEQKSE